MLEHVTHTLRCVVTCTFDDSVSIDPHEVPAVADRYHLKLRRCEAPKTESTHLNEDVFEVFRRLGGGAAHVDAGVVKYGRVARNDGDGRVEASPSELVE